MPVITLSEVLLFGPVGLVIEALDRQKAQAEVIQPYYTMLQTHLDCSYELAQTHQQRQASVNALREQCLRLELQREKLLASLN